ncbi:MAG: hypothetical protein FJY11_08710 [Bacteroidetes bacterium]|nr:hypothetical protein [Bacteroidota bacterium]
MKSAIRTIPFQPAGPVWMKAAVAGSIWASLEIIIGSFLHNLRVPFSGTILAVMSVYLMVGFLQVWNERGLVWRAGIICGLMKSVSPSAVIIGPMTGIMLEAILLETTIRLLGRNLTGYLAGGAIAVFSTLIHKIATLLILYGFDLVRIAADLYSFAVRQTGFETDRPEVLLLMISGVYLGAGMLAASGGYIAGRLYISKQKIPDPGVTLEHGSENSLFSHTSGDRYSLFSLMANVVMIVASLALLNMSHLSIAVTFGALYIIFVFIYYRNAARKLKKPGVWIQFAIIAFLSAFLWNSLSGVHILDPTGMVAGFKMIWRAMVVITGFAAVSAEMKNPLIKTVLYNRGLANLYQSLSLAFAALPSVISRLPAPNELLKKRKHSFGTLFHTAELLLPVLETENNRRPHIFIMTGDRLSGKTTFLKEIISILNERAINPAGFISEGIHESETRIGFKLTGIASEKRVELCSTVERPGMIRQGRFWFSREALQTGDEIIREAASSGAAVIVIDEVGPLEISGKGWYNAIENATASSDAVHVWSVRRSLVKKASRRWNTGDVTIVDTTTAIPEETALLIIEAANKVRGINGHSINL